MEMIYFCVMRDVFTPYLQISWRMGATWKRDKQGKIMSRIQTQFRHFVLCSIYKIISVMTTLYDSTGKYNGATFNLQLCIEFKVEV